MQKTSLGIYFIVFLLALAGAVTFNSDRVLSVVPAVTGLPHSNVAWPRVGDEYADLELFNLEGEPVRMSQYRGKVLLIEAIGMPCAACQAFSGAHELGGFGGIQPQPGLQSFEQYFQQYAGGASLSDERLVFIQILFYGPSARHAPTLEEARHWAEHFQLTSSDHTVVLFASDELISPATRQMIPGFQLVDKDFILRCDAGNPPRQNLYHTLLPMTPHLLKDVP